MKLIIPTQRNEELSFSKTNFSSSIYAENDEDEFFIVSNDIACRPDELKEFIANAAMPQSEVDGVEPGKKEKVYADRFRAKVLCAIAEFSCSLIAFRQLNDYLSLKENKPVAPSLLTSALNELRRLGLVDVCKIRKRGTQNDIVSLYKLSSSRTDDIKKALEGRLRLADGEKPDFSVKYRLPAFKVKENSLLCEIILAMFKARFISCANVPAAFDSNNLHGRITAFVEAIAENAADKKIYLFAPRVFPGWEEYLKDAVAVFIKEHAEDEALPKLLLCCEDAQSIYDAHDALSGLYDDVQIIYTDDLSLINGFIDSLSVFDVNGAELQLGIEPAQPSGKKPGKPASQGGGKRQNGDRNRQRRQNKK